MIADGKKCPYLAVKKFSALFRGENIKLKRGLLLFKLFSLI